MRYLILFLLVSIFHHNLSAQRIENDTKPNIIFILTDDLGYGDVGVFFQKQRELNNDRSKPFMHTPNLDIMAKNGAILEQYSPSSVCAPSRASFLSGQSQGHATVRDNQFDKALEDNYTVGNVLQAADYKTVAIGKWGLQGEEDKNIGASKWPAHPLKRGFDYYYGYIRHVDGHEHYPKEGIYRGPKEVWDNYTEVSQGLDKSYTGDLFTARAKQFIMDHKNGNEAEQPFFMFLSYDTPHAVLELPTQAYPAGGGIDGGLQWLGIPGEMINTASGTPDSWVHPDYNDATYDHDNDSTTPEIAWPATYKRYATIVRRIDDQVGDIIKLLKDLKIEDNTLVVFTSDNGVSDESYLPKEFVHNTPNFFEGFGPFDGIKRDILEGGLRVPTIAYWPNNIAPNTEIKTPSISYDWMPTFLDVAKFASPVRSDGVSLLPSLLGSRDQEESLIYVEYSNNSHTPSYLEFEENNRNRLRKQMQMIRIGDVVGVRYDIQSQNDDFELYNVTEDPSQRNNLAGESTTQLQNQMKDRSLQVRIPNPTAKRPYDEALIPSINIDKVKKGLKWSVYKNETPWLSKPQAGVKVKKGHTRTLSLSAIKQKEGFIEGYLRVPEDGKYTFTLKVGGKAFLKIHDISVIDADYNYKEGTVKSSDLFLEKGYHPIRIYFEKSTSRDAEIFLEWESSDIKKQKIDKDFFFVKK